MARADTLCHLPWFTNEWLKLPGPNPLWITALLQEGRQLSSPVRCQNRARGSQAGSKAGVLLYQVGPSSLGGQELIAHFKKMTEMVMKALEVVSCLSLCVLTTDSNPAFCSLLQEARQQLSCDHRCKMEALEIDRVCLSLNVNSPNISFKVNPTRVPDG